MNINSSQRMYLHSSTNMSMKINQIFGDLRDAGLDDKVRKEAQDLIRKILGHRRRMSLDNDVVQLYESRVVVAKHLNVPLSDLDVIWKVPSVASILAASLLEDSASTSHEHDEDKDEAVKVLVSDAMSFINRRLSSIQSDLSSFVILASVLNVTTTVLGVIAFKGMSDVCDASCREKILMSVQTGFDCVRSIVSRMVSTMTA